MPHIEESYLRLLDRIRETGTSTGRNLIAFSGGVDSSLVAHAVYQVFPLNCIACLGVSASLSDEQHRLARTIARHIGIPLREIATKETEKEEYIANEGMSCYYCKSELYGRLESLQDAIAELHFDEIVMLSEAKHLAAQATNQPLHSEPHDHPVMLSEAKHLTADQLKKNTVVIFNGTNADDMLDATRVGLKAAAEYRVVSPLASFTKSEVRGLARHAGLPNWNYAAMPCLRSRLQFGVAATEENLHRIGEAEAFIRSIASLDTTQNLRVRHLDGNIARIEADEEILARLKEADDDIAPKLSSLGFRAVEYLSFRSGSLSGAPEIHPSPE